MNIDKHPTNTPSWFDLMTPDPEAARAFYKGIFGWDYEIGDSASGHYSMAKIGDRNAAGMGKKPADAPYPSVWTVYFDVESADATVKAIEANGGSIMAPAMDVMEFGRMAIAIDPVGAPFGLWQPKLHTGAGVRDQHGAMGWQELHAPDTAKAREFYARVFQLEPVKLPAPGMDYWTLDKGPKQFGGMMNNKQLPPGVPPHWLVYFTVDSADAAAKAVTAGGGKVMQPPMDTPYGRLAVCVDPWQAAFAVVQPAKHA